MLPPLSHFKSFTGSIDINAVCREDSDCDDMRCYQGKCICPKDRPIEDRGLCLPCKYEYLKCELVVIQQVFNSTPLRAVQHLIINDAFIGPHLPLNLNF